MAGRKKMQGQPLRLLTIGALFDYRAARRPNHSTRAATCHLILDCLSHLTAAVHAATPHVSAPSSSHSFMSEYVIVTGHPTVPPREVLMAQTVIPSLHAQHLLYFAHEAFRRSRTSCATLEIAMCYVGAIRDVVRNILAEHLTRLAQYKCLPQHLDLFTIREGLSSCLP